MSFKRRISTEGGCKHTWHLNLRKKRRLDRIYKILEMERIKDVQTIPNNTGK